MSSICHLLMCDKLPQTQWCKTTQIYHLTHSGMGSSARVSPFLGALGKIYFHVHSGVWQNAILCSFPTEDPVPLLAVSQGPPTSQGPAACPTDPSLSSSSLLLLISDILQTPPRESFLLLRAHVIPFNQYNTIRESRILGTEGDISGATLEFLLPRPPYVYFLLRRLHYCPCTPRARGNNPPLTTCPAALASHHNAKKASLDKHCDIQTEMAFQEGLCLAQKLLCDHRCLVTRGSDFQK